jgi:hypothetical protein
MGGFASVAKWKCGCGVEWVRREARWGLWETPFSTVFRGSRDGCSLFFVLFQMNVVSFFVVSMTFPLLFYWPLCVF